MTKKLITSLNPSLSHAICAVINKSLQCGKVPKDMKIARVIPVFKAKDKTYMGNYRPISLLPSISKVLEKVVHHRLYAFLTKKSILNDNQYGFRPAHSTIDAVSKFTTHVLKSLENKLCTLAVFLDLSKAFDTIDHNILLAKLEYYGARGIALEWFRSYLCNRSQFVMYRDTESLRRMVSCGVPQGSVLGPLLFILYTNDLPAVLKHSQCILFVDDITVCISGRYEPVLRQQIENDLASLTDWFHANKLSLNVLKTNFMKFGKGNQVSEYDLHLSNNIITKVSSAKFLGIIIDDELGWSEHINHIERKIASGSYAIYSVKRFLFMNNMKLLYHSLIHSHLSYGTMLWSSASQYRLRKLEISQKKCIRNICNTKYNEHTSRLFKKLNILKLQDISRFQLGTFMYNFARSELPPPLMSLFTQNTDIHGHSTRQSRNPYVEHRQSKNISKTFIHLGPKLWNELPMSTKSVNSIHAFKSRLKRNLMEHY